MTIKKTKIMAAFFAILLLVLLCEIFYLNIFNSLTIEALNKKRANVALVGLPDFALAQESFIRHRSLSGIFNIYSIDAALREYATQTYTISNASIKEQR